MKEMKPPFVAATTIFILQFYSSDAFAPQAADARMQFVSQNQLTMTQGNSESDKSSCLIKTSTSTNSSRKKSKRLYSFEEARRIARGHGFDSKEEFLEYTCPGSYQIPKDADVVWAKSWNGWDDFLGLTLTFSEGRRVARGLGVETEEGYVALMKSKTIPDGDVASRLPYRPDLKYKEQWKGWDDFLVG